MTMKRIRLELARDHEFPNGSKDRGYEFAAPLDENGQLVADEWRQARERCRVKRFWPGRKDEIGRLVHRRGGHGRLITTPRAVKMMSQASSSIVTNLSRVSTCR